MTRLQPWIVGLLSVCALFYPASVSFAGPNACQIAARDDIDATQRYRNAVRDVSMTCSKHAGGCDDARAAADAALNSVIDAHIIMMNPCVVVTPPPPPPPPGTGRGRLILNEVDYDQPSTDTGEFVEIFNAGTETASLDGVAVVFVNGADNGEYLRINLSGSLNAGAYAVIASPAVVPQAGALVFPFPLSANNIQNGSPDGIAIIDTSTAAVLDALSYAGSITAAVINGVGTVSLVEGTALPTSVTDLSGTTGSLARIPNGQDTDDAAIDWRFTTTPTPGGPNN